MCNKCQDINELYNLESERLYNKTAKYFKIKNTLATKKAIDMALKLSHNTLLEIREDFEAVEKEQEESQEELIKLADNKTDHISFSILDIAYFIYSFSIQMDNNYIISEDEVYNSFAEMFLDEILEITNNVNSI